MTLGEESAQNEKKHTKRGLYDFGDFHGGFGHSYGSSFGHFEHDPVKTITLTKKVPYPVPHPVPYPVVKHVPVPYKVGNLKSVVALSH